MKQELSKELREVFEQLIPIYEKAVEEFPEKEWKDFLQDKYLNEGICYASDAILDIDISFEMCVIGNKISLNSFWLKTPNDYLQRKRAIDCLQWRINKMKELLKQKQ